MQFLQARGQVVGLMTLFLLLYASLQCNAFILNTAEFALAFARGTISKLEHERLAHPGEYKNSAVVLASITALRAIHASLSMYNTYNNDGGFDIQLGIAFLNDMMHGTHRDFANAHVSSPQELSATIANLRGQVLPEIERWSALFIAYCNTGAEVSEELQLLGRILFTSSRLCQAYLDQEREDIKNVVKVAVVAHGLYSIYLLITAYQNASNTSNNQLPLNNQQQPNNQQQIGGQQCQNATGDQSQSTTNTFGSQQSTAGAHSGVQNNTANNNVGNNTRTNTSWQEQREERRRQREEREQQERRERERRNQQQQQQEEERRQQREARERQQRNAWQQYLNHEREHQRLAREYEETVNQRREREREEREQRQAQEAEERLRQWEERSRRQSEELLRNRQQSREETQTRMRREGDENISRIIREREEAFRHVQEARNARIAENAPLIPIFPGIADQLRRGDDLNVIVQDNAAAVLGVGADATREDITQRHRHLSRQHHPDRNPDNQALAGRIQGVLNNARDVLVPPTNRPLTH